MNIYFTNFSESRISVPLPYPKRGSLKITWDLYIERFSDLQPKGPFQEQKALLLPQSDFSTFLLLCSTKSCAALGSA